MLPSFMHMMEVRSRGREDGIEKLPNRHSGTVARSLICEDRMKELVV